MTDSKDFFSPEHYFNRELSWLQFNARVLGLARDPKTPLLEQLKFLSIFSSNQDEFFMVRIAGLKRMQKEGIRLCDSPDQTQIDQVLASTRHKVMSDIKHQYECFEKKILPQLDKRGIQIRSIKTLDKPAKKFLGDYFFDEVFPVLTPLAVDPSHPFPFLNNLAHYIVVQFPDSSERDTGECFGFSPKLVIGCWPFRVRIANCIP